MSAAPRKIFCGGLPKNVSGPDLAQKLTELFSQFGTVVATDVKCDNAGINRGFGFVEFAEEFAVEALLKVDNHQLDGRRVEVKPYANNVPHIGGPKEVTPAEESYIPEPPPIPTGGDPKLFIGGLPQGVDEAKLIAYFGTFGTVSGAEVSIDKATGNNKGYGFVTFSDLSGVQKAIEQFATHEIDGKWIEVRQFGDKSAKRSAYNPPPPKAGGPGCDKWKTLFIGGLTKSTTNDQLWSHFQQFGEIALSDVRMDPLTGQSKGFGFVEYVNPQSIEYALQAQNQHHIDGKWVEVKRFGNDNSKGGGKGMSQPMMNWNQGYQAPPPHKPMHNPNVGWNNGSWNNGGMATANAVPIQQPVQHGMYNNFSGSQLQPMQQQWQQPQQQWQQTPPMQMQQQYPLSQTALTNNAFNAAYPMSASGYQPY